ncbi:hypothetical protein HDU90_005249 [Geranomyces variabilis]|nr:hypothetical protein HDU90_005249 [Geranomyces variabilis]
MSIAFPHRRARAAAPPAAGPPAARRGSPPLAFAVPPAPPPPPALTSPSRRPRSRNSSQQRSPPQKKSFTFACIISYFAVAALAAAAFVHPGTASFNFNAESTNTVPPSVYAVGALAVGSAAQLLFWIVTWAKHAPFLKRRARAIKDIIDGTTTQPCFFCNEDVTLPKEELAITGGRSWRCTFCGQWNGEDELDKPGFGTPGVRYTQRQQQQQQSHHHRQRQDQQHRQQQHDSLASYKSTLFCATCMQNQNLVVRLVAAYDPGDEEYYEMTIDEHKAQLEERYPLLCRECAVGVRVALTNETNKIKRRLLHERLVRSSTSSWDEAEEDAATRGRFVRHTVTWWRVLADLWHTAAIAVMLAVHIRGIMYPLSFIAAFCEGVPREATPSIPPTSLKSLESLSSFTCLAVPPRYEEDNVECVCRLLPALRWLNVLAVPGAVLHPLFLPFFGVDGDLLVYKTLQVRLYALRVLALYILADAWDPRIVAAVHACCLLLCAGWTRQWVQDLQWAKPSTKQANVLNPNNASASRAPPSLEQQFAATSGNSSSDILGIEHAFQRSATLTDRASEARLAQFRAKRAFHRRLLANLRSVGIPAAGAIALWTHASAAAAPQWLEMALTVALGIAWAVAFACHQDEIARKVARRRVRRRVTLLYAALSLRLVINICAWLLRYHHTEPNSYHAPSSADDVPTSYLPPELGALLPEWVHAIATPGVVATLVDFVGAITLFVCAPT